MTVDDKIKLTVCIAAFAVVIAAGTYFTKSPATPSYTALANDPPPAAPAQSQNTDRSDLVSNLDFNRRNPKYVPNVLKLIRGRSYECPALAKLWVISTETPYGMQLEALCGPTRGGGAYPKLHYAIYPEKLLVNVCAPFSVFAPECK